MKRLVFSFSILFLSISLFSLVAQAQPCQPGNTRNTAYMLRESDRRCEGIITPPISRPDFNLSSFAIGQLKPAARLTLEVPKLPNLSQPTVKLQSDVKYYQLEPLQLQDQGTKWQFQWSNEVIQKENIPLNTLRGVATINNVVIPVRFSQPSSVYDIRIYTGGRAKTITLQIKQNNGTVIYSKTLTNQPGDEVQFSWNGRNTQGKPVPAGRYTLKVEAKIEQRNAPPETRSITHQFEHNPTWLR